MSEQITKACKHCGVEYKLTIEAQGPLKLLAFDCGCRARRNYSWTTCGFKMGPNGFEWFSTDPERQLT